MNKKVLILEPNKQARGGITNYYLTIKKYLPAHYIYQKRGARHFPHHSGFIRESIRIIYDYFRFVIHLIFDNIKLVQTSTSLYKRAVIRDGGFILLSKIFRKRVIVFYRGWDLDYAEGLHSNKFFKFVYLNTQASIVLSNSASNSLKELNYSGKIFYGTTTVDNDLIKGINISYLERKYKTLPSKITILFLARIEKTKGIHELIEIYAKLKGKYNDLELVIAGDGREEEYIKRLVKDQKIEDISFTGFVQDDAKSEVFKKSHIFLFPSYSEGMPTSVLEAMAFGLPVITTAVGGLVDFFNSGINGFMLGPHPEPAAFINKTEILITNHDLMLEIAKNNYHYAQNHFLASKIAMENVNMYNEVLDNP